jgi:hypothetical protein
VDRHGGGLGGGGQGKGHGEKNEGGWPEMHRGLLGMRVHGLTRICAGGILRP